MGRKTVNRISGIKLRALMTEYGLKGNEGAARVSEIIFVNPKTVQLYLSRGISLPLFELLKCVLKHQL